jgi:ABC-type amino acid transport system permease subunit
MIHVKKKWGTLDNGIVIAVVLAGAYFTYRIQASLHYPLAVYEGAYITEIIRAGIQSIDKGQWEASSGLGFTRAQQLRYIIFPQALRRIMPPLAGQFISTIKDSAIVSVISIQELTFQGMELMAATFLTFEIWITMAWRRLWPPACGARNSRSTGSLRRGWRPQK